MSAVSPRPAGAGGALDEARWAFADRRFDAAARAAARALASRAGGEPREAVEAAALLAGALLAAGRPGPALSCLEGAAALAPGASWVHRLRALALLDLGRAAAAEVEAEEAARLAPADAWAHDALARALFRRGREVEARAAALRASSMAPADPHLRCSLGELYGSAHPLLAEGHLRAALELDGACAPAWAALGEVLERQGRAADAARARDRAGELDGALRERRGGGAAVLPILWIGASVLLLVVAVGLLPEVVRRASPAAAARIAAVAYLGALALPVAVVAASVAILRRARPQPLAAPIAAAVRDAARGGARQSAP
jgi:tetratricopeptide (TPR) repeat protein